MTSRHPALANAARATPLAPVRRRSPGAVLACLLALALLPWTWASPLAGGGFGGPIAMRGKALVTASDGQRFMVRGVALASNVPDTDLLADRSYEDLAHRILPRLLGLHVNAVRVYRVDPSQGHGRAMDLLKSNGIYVEVAMASEGINVNRVAPVYSLALRSRVLAVVDAFSGYENVLGFSAGNEVVFPAVIYDYVARTETPRQCASPPECVARTVGLEAQAAAVVKALIRDAKARLHSRGRAIPVGVALADTPQSSLYPAGLVGTDTVARYYACGPRAERADYLGFNSYRYVPGGGMDAYDGLAREVADLPVPVYLTESGAIGDSNRPQERDWKIVGAGYRRPLLIDNLSGEIAYALQNEPNNFGLYYEDADLTETAWGGARALAQAFAEASGIRVRMPRVNPRSVACPTRFNPPLPPAPAPIDIAIANHASAPLQAIQDGSVLATLPARTEGAPSLARVQIDPARGLTILDHLHGYNLVCSVAPGALQDGWTVSDDVPWGSACGLAHRHPRGGALGSPD